MRRYTSAALAVLMLLASASAMANSYSTPDIDGRVEIAEHDWDTDERAGTDSRFDCRYYPDEGDLRDLWITWDETNLYFGVRTVNGPGTDPGNGYVLYIDTDAQEGITGATDFTSATFYPRNVTFSTMGVDVMFGVWNLGTGSEGIRHCDNLLVMEPVDGAYALMNPGVKHYEGVIPWDGLYGLGEGMVPPGTTLRVVAAIVGGDNTGAFDALPTTSHGAESDPATPRDAYTDLDLYHEIPVDADLDGIPDRNYPPGGGIAGTVTLSDPADTETVVTVTAYQNGVEIWFDKTPSSGGGGPYEIERLADGFYDVIAEAESYMTETIEGVEVADTLVTTGIDFALQKVTGRIDGQVAISGGPAVDVTVGAYDAVTGELGGEGEVVVEGGTGAFSIGTIGDGEWLVLAEGKGYVEAEASATIAGGDSTDVGLLELPVVVATKYGFSNQSGDNIYSVGTTVSLPADTIYFWAEAWVEPRDDGDRIAYWDYGAQMWLELSATKLDPAYPTDGDILFADADTVELPHGNVIMADMFEDGRAPFLVSGDAVEVVRVRATRDSAGASREGFLEVGIDPPAPVALELSADVATIAAGSGVATISGQLIDASGNEAHVSGIIANMTSSGVGGGGGFSIPSPETDPDGKFSTGYSAATAGTTYVTATIDPGSAYPNLTVNELTIVITPDVAAYVAIEPDPRAVRAMDVSTIGAQVKDAWGNDVEEQGLSITLTADPPALLSSIESPIVTDATGYASGEVESGTTYGTVAITGTAAGVEIGNIYLPIDATIRAMDEVAPETDAAHNSDPGIDLTALRISNSSAELVVGMIFDSDWSGAHLGICIEANGDATGAPSDPFVFPINYGHALLPDYAFTYKYYDRSYADFRRWNTDLGLWQWHGWETGGWYTDWDNDAGIPANERQMDHEGYDVYFRIPFDVIGVSVGDTVRVQGYTMQETQVEDQTVKYTALDSAPHDNTHDMLPATGDWWETAEQPVTLSNYQTYVIREEGFAPALSDGSASPSPARPGQIVTYSVQVTDTGGGIGDVFLNLSAIGGEPFVRMTDDGSRGDEYARDGTYTAQDELMSVAANGEHTVTVTASDATNEASSTLGIVIDVDNPATAIREFEDPVGDDHGPNQKTAGGDPIEGLYYEYPTNQVFPDFAFDIESVKIFADGDRIVFRTYIGQLPDHQSGSSADWGAPNPSAAACDNPNRTDLNLQKIDIYIDAMEGKGATSGFPNRMVDIAAVDAWDYGIAVEGWGKWFVVSNSSNSIASWTRLEDDGSISMCDDHAQDWIDISIDRTLLGLPEDPSQNDAIALWDIIVCLSSHDGNSDRDNLGGIRWVNGNTSEWQIGGGRDGEGGRERDANIMDVAVSPGQGHEPGRPQEEMLDYTTPEAERRFDENKVACVLEASFAVDTSPPVIAPFSSFLDRGNELQHVPWVALNGAPGVFWTTITDVTGIETARLHWHPVGLPALQDSVDMVNLVGDIWGADVARPDIIANTNVVELNKVGDARVLEGWVYAVDASDSANATRTSPVTFGVLEPWWDSQTITVGDTLDAEDEQLIVFQDGSAVSVEADDLAWSRADVEFTITPIPESLVDTENIRDDMEFVGVAREVRAEHTDQTAVSFDGAPTLTLHYPQYDVGGLAEDDFGLFGWIPETERWVLKGGAANPRGNTVTGEILDAGTYGVFYWESLDVGGAEGLSGVMVEPNPFSPNGDGIYDETIITYFLGREADYVNLEFYDLEGRLVRRLVFQEATDFTARTPITREWDGTDKDGNVVPYGIYIMRVEAKFKTEPTFERVNRPVVIIK